MQLESDQKPAFKIEILEIDPKDLAQNKTKLQQVLDKIDFVGGQAQIADNLEGRHIFRGSIKDIKIAGENLDTVHIF